MRFVGFNWFGETDDEGMETIDCRHSGGLKVKSLKEKRMRT